MRRVARMDHGHQTISSDLNIPGEFIDAEIRNASDGASWQEAIAAWLDTRAPSGDRAANERTARDVLARAGARRRNEPAATDLADQHRTLAVSRVRVRRPNPPVHLHGHHNGGRDASNPILSMAASLRRGSAACRGARKGGNVAVKESMRMLVTVKAYPGLSQRRGETVCVAGVRLDTEHAAWVK